MINFKSAHSKGFTLIELLIVITIIGILSSIGLNAFQSSQKKSHDARRKSDLKHISNALEAYYNDKGQYPIDDSGKIKGCGTDAEETCNWGDKFWNETTETVYMIELPSDQSSGYYYYYDTDNTDPVYYQLYARLENLNDSSVHKSGTTPQTYQNTNCISTPTECNYGISSPNTTPEINHTLIP